MSSFAVFLTILQMFSNEVTLIRNQVLINAGAYDPKLFFTENQCFYLEILNLILLLWGPKYQGNKANNWANTEVEANYLLHLEDLVARDLNSYPAAHASE